MSNRKIQGVTLRGSLGGRYILTHQGHSVVFIPTVGRRSGKPIFWRAFAVAGGATNKTVVAEGSNTLKLCVERALWWIENSQLPLCSVCSGQLHKGDQLRDNRIYGVHGDLDYIEVMHKDCVPTTAERTA